VRSEIIRCRGRQFDPAITDRLIASALWHTLFQPPKRTASPVRVLALLGGQKGMRESA